jgi:hypothetical protein
VTLGGTVLEALKTIEYHQYTLQADAAKSFGWNDNILVPLYNPIPQVTVSHWRENEQFEEKKWRSDCRYF